MQTTYSPIGDPMEGHCEPVLCVAISGDGKMVVSGSSDNTVRTVGRRIRGAQFGAPLRGHEEEITSVSISTDRQIYSF